MLLHLNKKPLLRQKILKLINKKPLLRQKILKMINKKPLLRQKILKLSLLSNLRLLSKTKIYDKYANIIQNELLINKQKFSSNVHSLRSLPLA